MGFKPTKTTQFVRVYTDGQTNRIGKRIMKHSNIEGLTPIQIKTKYALPYTPTHYCYVNVPSGTKMYSGIVGENFGRVAGEAVKFELAKQIAENAFSSGISLP